MNIVDLYRAVKTLVVFYSSTINRSVDVGGNTLLHYAACYKDHDMIKFLLECGATLYCKNNAGDIPLDYL